MLVQVSLCQTRAGLRGQRVRDRPWTTEPFRAGRFPIFDRAPSLRTCGGLFRPRTNMCCRREQSDERSDGLGLLPSSPPCAVDNRRSNSCTRDLMARHRYAVARHPRTRRSRRHHPWCIRKASRAVQSSFSTSCQDQCFGECLKLCRVSRTA